MGHREVDRRQIGGVIRKTKGEQDKRGREK